MAAIAIAAVDTGFNFITLYFVYAKTGCGLGHPKEIFFEGRLDQEARPRRSRAFAAGSVMGCPIYFAPVGLGAAGVVGLGATGVAGLDAAGAAFAGAAPAPELLSYKAMISPVTSTPVAANITCEVC